jgi:hypothetical protein
VGLPDVFVVEVMVTKTTDDPPLRVYHTKVSNGRGDWQETYGSREQLQAHLRGLEVMLHMTGYQVALLGWDQPDNWDRPAGRRWTIPLIGSNCDPLIEGLDHDGAALPGV